MGYLWIPGQLPDYTTLVGAAMKPGRLNLGWLAYARVKDGAEQAIGFQINRARFKVTGGCFTYLFVEPNRRRDPSNFVSGGIKVIEDAFRRAKLIPNDGWANVSNIRPYWITCDYTSGVMVWAEKAPLSYETVFKEFLNGPGHEEKRELEDITNAGSGAPDDGGNLASARQAPGRRCSSKSGGVGGVESPLGAARAGQRRGGRGSVR